MARIAGVDLPRDKRLDIALTYIYGIGTTSANQIVAGTGIDPATRVRAFVCVRWPRTGKLRRWRIPW